MKLPAIFIIRGKNNANHALWRVETLTIDRRKFSGDNYPRTLRMAPEIPFADITNFVPWSIKRTSAGVCSDPVNFLHVPHKWRRLCFFTMILRVMNFMTIMTLKFNKSSYKRYGKCLRLY
uniref:Uncharacterized protein n=1 Tax=Triticum urartu TaxID=4572 RepID=A0A8R7U3Y9_TRIUA